MGTRVRRTVGTTLLAVAIAGPLAAVQAAPANALPISTLTTECRQAGGTWYVDYGYNGNVRYVTGYQCFYRDIHGDRYVDFFDRRGNYQGTG
ncbi:MAG: hypothetical protein QM658_02480 [Gordonia sp. (in: high G+C Gram-positive bacteria)]